MSGGHWNYLSFKLEERAGYADVWKLLAAIEHELDWGISCDTCYECAKMRVIQALEAYFDDDATDVKKPIELVRDRKLECERCKKE